MNYSIDLYILQAYFDGELNEEDTLRIESMALANPEFAEQLRNFQVSYEISKQEWRNQVRQQLQRSDRRRILLGRYSIISIAAAITLALSAIWFFRNKVAKNNFNSNIDLLVPLLDDPANSHTWTNRNFLLRLDSSRVGILYLNGEYRTVVELTQDRTVKDEDFFLRGLSLFKENRIEEAIAVFIQIAHPGNLPEWFFAAKWNLLIIYCSDPWLYERQLCSLLKQMRNTNYYQSDSGGYKTRLREVDNFLDTKRFSCRE